MAEQPAKHGTIRQRLSDRKKFPRSLWYPVVQNPWPDPKDKEAWQKDFEEVSATVRRSMFVLLGYSVFCLVALGQSDEQILKTSGFELPFIGSTVTVEGFALVGPLLLIALTFYLHIFLGRLRALNERKTDQNLSPLFFLDLRMRVTRILTALIFYWLPPLMLFLFAWKGAPFLNHVVKDVFLFVLATGTTAALALISIRRCPDDRRKAQNWFAWLVVVVLVFLWFEPQTEWAPELVPADREILWDSEPFIIPTVTFDDRYTFIKPHSIFWPKLDFMVLRRSLFLDRADLSGATLPDTDLSGARISFSALNGSNLRHADLYDATLFFADLRNADLRHAELSKAYLRDSDIMDADLRNANLEDAYLRDANLSNSNLRHAFLRGADLVHADLSGVDLTDAFLDDADLDDAELSGADLTFAFLGDAVLVDADLSFANLFGADLSGANLLRADLTSAGLVEADLRDADLRGVNLTNANLAGARGITCEQLAYVKGAPAQLPSDIDDSCLQ